VIRSALFFIIFLLAVALPAAAQTVVADHVSAEATEGNSQPKFGRDAAGGIYLTYVKPVAGVDQIFIASSPDGGRRWRNTQLTRRALHSRYPALAVEPDGTLHAVWTTYEPIGHVYHSRFSGGRWSAPAKISPGDAYAGVPAIAVAPNHDLHVVWYGIRNQAPQVRTRHGSIYEIMYTGLVRGRWSSPVVISPGIPDSINPALAIDRSGGLHSAWYQFDARAYQVRYARSRQGRWENPQQITTGPVDAFAVALALGPADRVFLVWEHRSPGRAEIYFAEGPDRWNTPTPISGPEPSSHPSVAVDAGGRVFVAWESAGRLQLRRRTDRWLGIERVMQDGQNRYPILAAGGEDVDLMWTQEIGGTPRLRFVSLGGISGSRRRAGGVGLLILTLFAALLLWQLRRRQRLAPR
jgi:hypothetical protein